MSYGLNNDGEVALLNEYFTNQKVNMGLYRESTDTLSDADTVETITSEPTGSNYERQEVDGSQVDVIHNSGSGLVDVNAQTFNVSDSSSKVDAVFLHNPTDDFFLRLGIDTTDYPSDYVDLSQLDNLRVGGDALTLE